MNYPFKHGTKLFNLLSKEPKVYISPVRAAEEMDIKTATPFNIKEDPYGNLIFIPSKSDVISNYKKFKKEFTSNKYSTNFDLNKAVSSYVRIFKPLLENYHVVAYAKQTFYLHKNLKVFYDVEFHYEAPILKGWHQKVNSNALKEIYQYCTTLKEIIEIVIETVNSSLESNDNVIDIEALSIPARDPNDNRIYVEAPVSEIKKYFSFLSQPTEHGQIMSEEDLEYFLNKNFAGFPKNTKSRSISFSIIAAVDFRFIIYRFYKKFKPHSSRTEWAQLLHDSFPNKFTGNVRTTASNFKENYTTVQKLRKLNIPHPF